MTVRLSMRHLIHLPTLWQDETRNDAHEPTTKQDDNMCVHQWPWLTICSLPGSICVISYPDTFLAKATRFTVIKHEQVAIPAAPKLQPMIRPLSAKPASFINSSGALTKQT